MQINYIIYDVEYTGSLSPQIVLEEIGLGVDYILLYSKNSASNFINLANRYNLLQKIKKSVVIALSEEIASIMSGYVDESLFVDIPHAAGMLKIFGRL
jgi:hypothetical protein